MITRIGSPLLILLLAFSVIAQDNDETLEEENARLQEENEQLREDNREQSVELQRERDANEVLENQAQRDEEGDTVTRVLSAVDYILSTPLAPVYEGGKDLAGDVLGECDKCGLLGVGGTDHRYSCKAGHYWWTCDPGDGKWQHDHCCRGNLVWTDSYGCVEPGYSPPSNSGYSDDYDASGGSDSEDCTGEGCD